MQWSVRLLEFNNVINHIQNFKNCSAPSINSLGYSFSNLGFIYPIQNKIEIVTTPAFNNWLFLFEKKKAALRAAFFE